MQIIIRKKVEPLLLIDPLAITKIDFLVSLAKKEVGWLGSIRDLGEYRFYLDDIYLFKQTVTGSETDMDALALAEFFNEHSDKAESIRFWGHSHVNMGVSPSGTDTTTIKELYENSGDFFIMGIFNKKHEYRIDIYTEDLILQQVEWRPYLPNTNLSDLKKEFDEKVTEQVYTNYYKGGNKTVYNPPYSQKNMFDKGEKSDAIDNYTSSNRKDTTGHKETSSSLRSLKPQQKDKDRHHRVWGNRKQDNNEPSQAGAKKS